MSKYFSNLVVENSLCFMQNQESRLSLALSLSLFRYFSLALSLSLSLCFCFSCVSQNQSSVAWHSLIYWINIDFSFDLQMSPEKTGPQPFIEIPVTAMPSINSTLLRVIYFVNFYAPQFIIIQQIGTFRWFPVRLYVRYDIAMRLTSIFRVMPDALIPRFSGRSYKMLINFG